MKIANIGTQKTVATDKDGVEELLDIDARNGIVQPQRKKKNRLEFGIRDENPCGGCKRPWKKPGCHYTCPDRKPWLEELERVNKARKAYANKPRPKVNGCW